MNVFKNRRLKLAKKILDQSLVFIFSGSVKKQSEDSEYPFFVNRNFFYLTNLSQENSFFIMYKNKKEIKEYLFIDEINEKTTKWFGKKIDFQSVKQLTNIDHIFSNNQLSDKIKDLLTTYNVKNIYVDFHHLDEEKVIHFINEKNNNFNVIDIYPLIRDLRMIKDKEEIKNIKEAIKITYIGLKTIIEKLKIQSKKEIEIYNSFNASILNLGTHEIAFPSIIASGENACCLHYSKPYSSINDYDLILCDVGASYQHYCADITRTFPVCGVFSEYQTKIYQIVLECSKKVIDYIKPGMKLCEIQKFAKNFLATRCLKNKIIKSLSDIDKYYFHNISHHLGLDVHDVSDKDYQLAPGMVITVEPGLYIQEKKIGIRIEDDVLITKDGCQCLSDFIPKDIEKIKKLFNFNIKKV